MHPVAGAPGWFLPGLRLSHPALFPHTPRATQDGATPADSRRTRRFTSDGRRGGPIPVLPTVWTGSADDELPENRAGAEPPRGALESPAGVGAGLAGRLPGFGGSGGLLRGGPRTAAP